MNRLHVTAISSWEMLNLCINRDLSTTVLHILVHILIKSHDPCMGISSC